LVKFQYFKPAKKYQTSRVEIISEKKQKTGILNFSKILYVV